MSDMPGPAQLKMPIAAVLRMVPTKNERRSRWNQLLRVSVAECSLWTAISA